MTRSSNHSAEREWLLLIVGAIATIGTTLTGFVCLEILHIETRLAVLEYRLGDRAPSILNWNKETSRDRSSILASVVPFMFSAHDQEKEAVGIKDAVGKRDTCGPDALSEIPGVCFAVPELCSSRCNRTQFPDSVRKPWENIFGGLNARRNP